RTRRRAERARSAAGRCLHLGGDGARARRGLRAGRVGLEPLTVRLDEEPDELLEAQLRRPAEHRLGLRRVPDEVVELGGATVEGSVGADVLAPVEADRLERT